MFQEQALVAPLQVLIVLEDFLSETLFLTPLSLLHLFSFAKCSNSDVGLVNIRQQETFLNFTRPIIIVEVQPRISYRVFQFALDRKEPIKAFG